MITADSPSGVRIIPPKLPPDLLGWLRWRRAFWREIREASALEGLARSMRVFRGHVHRRQEKRRIVHAPRVGYPGVPSGREATVIQCMPSHPMHSAYVARAKEARDRLALEPREFGRGTWEEPRGIRWKPPVAQPITTEQWRLDDLNLSEWLGDPARRRRNSSRLLPVKPSTATSARPPVSTPPTEPRALA